MKTLLRAIKNLFADDIGNVSDGYHTFDELYDHRDLLFLCLAKEYGGWKASLHDDGTLFPGYFIAGFNSPYGEITYHIPNTLWNTADLIKKDRAPAWDGYTSADVLKRLMRISCPQTHQ